MEVKVIADSIGTNGVRLTTIQAKYPRMIHAEVMTHRTFCLSGDAVLHFDMPRRGSGKSRRIQHVTVRDFANKWLLGAACGKSARHNGVYLDQLVEGGTYSVSQIAQILGVGKSNLNRACRNGEIAAEKYSGEWFAFGREWREWRKNSGVRKFSLRSRLINMNLRQLNEDSREIQTTNVIDCVASGVKHVFRLKAGTFQVDASKDHRILTDSGWKTMSEIVPGVDSVTTYNYGTGAGDQTKHKLVDGRWVSTWTHAIKAEVIRRQNYVCPVSGEDLRLSKCEIHHIVPVHVDQSKAFDIDNVIAVTTKSHKHLHAKQGWQIGAKLTSQWVKVDSVTSVGEIDTYDLEVSSEYENFFANGIVVHNSRNASSSRAIPSSRLVTDSIENMVLPLRWGSNQAGMQAASSNLSFEAEVEAELIWRNMAQACAEGVARLSELGLHKQWANRPLEWFGNISVVITATEWRNFFDLRIHEAAQPEIQMLAKMIRDAMAVSVPALKNIGEWHLPYVRDDEDMPLCDKIICSAARCARVSYMRHDGTPPPFEDDLTLYKRLVESNPPHMSPVEHQAEYLANDYRFFANFKSWRQHRQTLER